MTLNRDDFPEMTDEQWKAIEAEADRRANEASSTARTKAEKAAEKAKESEIQAAVQKALEEERTRLEMDEAQKLEADRQKLAEAAAELATERKKLSATKKLAAVFSDEKVESLLPMFVAVDDANLDATLDAFISTYNDTVKTQVDTVKQELLGNATPPAGNTGNPTDATAAANKMAQDGNPVGALGALLAEAGYSS